MNMHALREGVGKFGNVWFPADGSCPKYWFRARDARYRGDVAKLCDEVYETSNTLVSGGSIPEAVFDEIRALEWSESELVVLSIMLDQMPRNALAIGYGKFANASPTDIRGNIDDSWSIGFASQVLRTVDVSHIQDERIVCFFSLIFRHADQFGEARAILGSFPRSDSSLVIRFLNETDKRESSKLTS